jgi:hypothetical protein
VPRPGKKIIGLALLSSPSLPLHRKEAAPAGKLGPQGLDPYLCAIRQDIGTFR